MLITLPRHHNRVEKVSVLSMQLNLDYIHSHPEFRDTLLVIKMLVGMFVKCSDLQK